MDRKIVAITDMDSSGSGYRNLSVNLFSGLANLGYEIKVVGLGYNGIEHHYPFSILPCLSVDDSLQMVQNINALWNPDIFLVALDIPLQQHLFMNLKPLGKKYIAITPLENGPLVLDRDWENVWIP